jgi:hypothetical protein
VSFPLSLDGRVEVPLIEPDAVPGLLTSLEIALGYAGATRIMRDGSTISFRGQVTKWHFGWGALSAIDDGSLAIGFGRPGAVRYRCSTLYLLVAVSLAAVVFGVVFARGSAVRAIVLMLIVWGVSFGAGYYVSGLRLQGWLRSTLAGRT